METNVRPWSNVNLRRNQQTFVNGTDPPVQNTNQDFQRRATKRKDVFGHEELGGERQVGEEPGYKGRV